MPNESYSVLKKVRLTEEPYLIINIFLAGIILLIMLYSGIFSPDKDKYPVKCIHQEITGEPCVSCGLSHSFSLIIRGRLDEAYSWNIYGMRVFIFFAAQFIFRILFSYIYIRYTGTRKQLIRLDIFGSSLIFLLSFWQFMAYILKFS